MPDISQFVAEARSYTGTPFLHQGRVKGEGVDCVGVLIGSAKKAGFLEPEYQSPAYDMMNDGSLLFGELERYAREIDFEEVREGDILIFTVPDPQHAGVVTEVGGRFYVLHALNRNGVVEHILDHRWIKRIESVWRLIGAG